MNEILWVEKYRPSTISDAILPFELKQTFQQFVDNQNCPNLLLSGSAGCGKTTEILKMLKRNFEAGLHFDQALMIGFAKATVENLKDRAQNDKTLSLFFTEKQADSIKTIHKFCKDH